MRPHDMSEGMDREEGSNGEMGDGDDLKGEKWRKRYEEVMNAFEAFKQRFGPHLTCAPPLSLANRASAASALVSMASILPLSSDAW
ncbi:hypothetical protein PAXINDRAFT_102372 [Paxillus involutus ATCC 200175]|uniref:Uncharacterized protein n=1 Tax=Paxillus involutus ATCC 200175 TaxID=664439 RepID=A0A0C9TDH2_PAXIN|nr:hypothetical protein PAXINDRAFT_102372 [Paxillus involutus ATCC 200175]